MSDQWITKHRPSSFPQIVGNEFQVTIAKKFLARPPGSFLISGPTGCGKTTMARIIAKELAGVNVSEPELSSDRGINAVRALINQGNHKPLTGDRKVIIVDECHTLTDDAKHSFLKALEEPPAHLTWILVTNHPEKLPQEMLNRTQQISMQVPTSEDIIKCLLRIAKKENIKAPRPYLTQIAEVCKNVPRECVSFFERSCLIFNGKLPRTSEEIFQHFEQIIKMNPKEGLFRWSVVLLIHLYTGTVGDVIVDGNLSLMEYSPREIAMNMKLLNYTALIRMANKTKIKPVDIHERKLLRHLLGNKIPVEDVLMVQKKLNKLTESEKLQEEIFITDLALMIG